jgi:hypothetical protein
MMSSSILKIERRRINHLTVHYRHNCLKSPPGFITSTGGREDVLFYLVAFPKPIEDESYQLSLTYYIINITLIC